MFENRTKCTQVGFLVGGIEMLTANEVFDFFQIYRKKMCFDAFKWIQVLVFSFFIQYNEGVVASVSIYHYNLVN